MLINQFPYSVLEFWCQCSSEKDKLTRKWSKKQQNVLDWRGRLNKNVDFWKGWTSETREPPPTSSVGFFLLSAAERRPPRLRLVSFFLGPHPQKSSPLRTRYLLVSIWLFSTKISMSDLVWVGLVDLMRRFFFRFSRKINVFQKTQLFCKGTNSIESIHSFLPSSCVLTVFLAL